MAWCRFGLTILEACVSSRRPAASAVVDRILQLHLSRHVDSPEEA
jgi:hypothetical protein